jgi:hypothetical protein
LVLITTGALVLTALVTASRASAGTLYACVKKDGSAHIYSKKPKCKKREAKLSWSTTGPAGRNGAKGLNGANGVNGVNGIQGPIGPQGPGATISTYDAPASASPVRVPVGSFPGGTLSAECAIPAPGEAALRVYAQTSNGSWTVDYTYLTTQTGVATPEVFTNHLAFPAPGLTTPTLIETLTAKASPFVANRHIDFVQLAPAKAQMIWHETAETTSTAQTCHFSVMSFPAS